MAMNENLPEVSTDTGSKVRGKAYSLHPLHEAAMRIADLGRNRSRSRTKDLINVLLAHGARAWRYSQPEAKIHLHIAASGGRAAVVMRLR